MIRKTGIEWFLYSTLIESRQNLVPKSLQSMTIESESYQNLGLINHLTPVFESLDSLNVSCVSPLPFTYQILSKCKNLRRLTFLHEEIADFSFLRSMPHLRCLADHSGGGFRIEDASAISQGVSIRYLSFYLPTKISSEFVTCIGRELRSVTHLMINGMTSTLRYFLEAFRVNPWLFPRLCTLRVRVLDAENIKDIETFGENRPQCEVSELLFGNHKVEDFCDVCGQKRSPNWMCSRCETYICSMN